jgi:membrane-bound metal-dependent hydrolase YbcI (DUF457 family)
MFIGHFALGFAAKRVAPRVSLAVLFAAVAWADLVWPVLVGADIEQVRIDPGNTVFTPLDFVSYPYSHSLLTLVLWGAVFAISYRATTGKNGSTFAVLTVLVVSHWLLDFVTHRPDMPLYPGGPKLGLGLWNSTAGTELVEVAMYAVGVWIYMRATRPLDAVGRWSSVALVAFLLVAYLVNNASGPPPSVKVLWVSAIIATAILLLWAWWTDRHREPRSA